MKEYKYNSVKMLKRYNNLLKVYHSLKKSKDESLLNRCFESLEIYEDIIFPHFYLFFLTKSDLELQVDEWEKIKEDIILLKKLSMPKIDLNNNKFFVRNINLNDTFELMREFYKNTDKEFLKYYEKFYKDKKNIFYIRNNKVPEFFVSPFDNKFFISSMFYNDLDSLVTLTHECSHYISYQLIDNYDSFCNRQFVETETTFLQLLSNRFYSNLLNIEKEGLANEYDYLKIIKLDIEEVSEKDNLLKDISKFNLNNISMKFFYEFCKKEHNFNMIEINKLFSSSFHELLNYSIPFMVTIELLDEWEKDKENSIYILKKLMKEDNGNNYYDILKDNNVEVGKHVEDYSLSLKNKFECSKMK